LTIYLHSTSARQQAAGNRGCDQQARRSRPADHHSRGPGLRQGRLRSASRTGPQRRRTSRACGHDGRRDRVHRRRRHRAHPRPAAAPGRPL